MTRVNRLPTCPVARGERYCYVRAAVMAMILVLERILGPTGKPPCPPLPKRPRCQRLPASACATKAASHLRGGGCGTSVEVARAAHAARPATSKVKRSSLTFSRKGGDDGLHAKWSLALGVRRCCTLVYG